MMFSTMIPMIAALVRRCFIRGLQTLREKRGTVTPKGVGIQGQHDDVTDPEKKVHAPGKEAIAESFQEKFYRSSLARVGYGKPGIGVRRDEGNNSGYGEGNRRPATGELNGQP
jgi:hypothetical protein